MVNLLTATFTIPDDMQVLDEGQDDRNEQVQTDRGSDPGLGVRCE